MNISVGSIYPSNNFGDFKVLEIKNSREVLIEFVATGFRQIISKQAVTLGRAKDKLVPSVFGVGVIGSKYPTKENGVLCREYKVWVRILERCFSDDYQRKYPTYKGCGLSENFKSYEYFYEWCNRQKGFCYAPKWHLDKDLLGGGNFYSEQTCIFLPSEVNVAFTKSDAKRGSLPLGVHSKNGKFIASCKKGSDKRKYIGAFETKEQAFNAYKLEKESYIKSLAEKYKQDLDPRAYKALVSYKVSIND